MKTGWIAYARFDPYDPSGDGHSLIVIRADHLGRSFVKSMVLEKISEGVSVVPDIQPFIPHHEVPDFLRAMMDAAWEIGLRPSGYEDHANELSAVRDHLADMRKLAKIPN
ncbi:hypothetical protein LCGC14_1963900 [marine sediment metagenome]|uniref:Uncharacterized protein n=1 Tax=marine sediment metagenome TaxID=412755 RepID=A0A0F9FDP6_9ZZZZ